MYRGEVWLLNLDPTIGAEIRKTRPGIIVNDNAIGTLPLKIIVPLTDWKNRYEIAPWMVKIEGNERNGLLKDFAADTFQVRSISEVRFIRKIGAVSEVELDRISKALTVVLAI
ncbi:MAG: type II toxin-antitoxin system PemK/MazF family toxin [Deltaproteobacteria bacterium]|nr:type II toxin-antitoxin system PemK/MazF family toxin [Candidatus Tharpella aukensis]